MPEETENKLFSMPNHETEQCLTNPRDDTRSCSGSPCFKVPVLRPSTDTASSRNINQLTPRVFPKLVNLSFSQPNSPRTPCSVGTKPYPRLATPVTACSTNGFAQRQEDQSVLNTPCVMGALHELQKAQVNGLPDMLALIEDDTTGLCQVEQQLLRNTEVELTDNNVVDYLLYVAHDESLVLSADHQCDHQQHVQHSDQYIQSREASSFVDENETQLNVRRKRRRRSQKRMTAEEVRVMRARRTRQFTSCTSSSTSEEESCLGLRKSKRTRRQPSRLQVNW